MKTALYQRHKELGAKFIDFEGWTMPLHYPKGIAFEHQAVRGGVGLFDVSHMGRIAITGQDAEYFLEFLSTNSILGEEDNKVIYAVWCAENGNAVDDLLVFKKNPESYFVVANAANRHKDMKHLQQFKAGYNVKIEALYEQEGIISVQGPESMHLMARFFPKVRSLQHMHFMDYKRDADEIIVSRTGYTGSLGFEIFGSNRALISLWDDFLEVGKEFKLEPAGLGARDTLRLEMGYALYGHELSDAIAPTESVAAWTVKWGKSDFIGKQALKKLSLKSSKRNAYGLVLQDPGIPRVGYKVFYKGQQIGEVTSGTFSPSLKKGIALILVKGKLLPQSTVELLIRENLVRAQVVSLPFVNCSH